MQGKSNLVLTLAGKNVFSRKGTNRQHCICKIQPSCCGCEGAITSVGGHLKSAVGMHRDS